MIPVSEGLLTGALAVMLVSQLILFHILPRSSNIFDSFVANWIVASSISVSLFYIYLVFVPQVF